MLANMLMCMFWNRELKIVTRRAVAGNEEWYYRELNGEWGW